MNKNADSYNHAAYRHTVWKEAARLLRERYFPEDGSPHVLISEHVFRVSKEVPGEVIQEVLLALHKAERTDENLMSHFNLAEKKDGNVKDLTAEDGEGTPSKKAPSRRTRRKAG
jgi:hypothetical protein